MTHASKRKGNGFEREIVNLLQEAGITANRVPLSGAVSGYEGDLRISVGGLEWRGECKRRKRCFSTIEGMRGRNDILFVRDDRTSPLAIISVETFCALVRELNYYKDNYIAQKRAAREYADDH